MATNNVDVLLSLRGGKKFRAETDASSKSLRRMGDETGRTSQHAARMERSTRASSSGLIALGAAAKTGTAAAVVGLGLAAKGGLAFNASMEQNQIAFTNFLGSSRKAKAYLGDLYKLAATTPFEFPELTEAAVKLMGFGMSAKQTRSLLGSLGDAVAGVGGGSEQIQQATLALGQMQAKGKVSMEELNQLTEARIPAMTILKKELHLSTKEMAQLGNQGISAKKAIPALQRGLDRMFHGQAAKQGQSFNGQISTLKDNINLLLGQASKPLFDYLRTTALPALNKLVQSLRGGNSAFAKAKGYVSGLFGQFQGGTTKLNGVKASMRDVATIAINVWRATLAAVRMALPGITQAVRGGFQIIGGIVKVFASILRGDFGGAWRGVKQIVRGSLNMILGVMRAVTAPLRAAGAAIGSAIWGAMKSGANATIDFFRNRVNDLLGVVNSAIDAFNKIPGPDIGKIGLLGGGGRPSTTLAGPRGGAPTGGGSMTRGPHAATGATLHSGGAAFVGEAGMEVVRNQAGKTIVNPVAKHEPVNVGRGLASSMRSALQVPVYLNGRQIALATADDVDRQMARA